MYKEMYFGPVILFYRLVACYTLGSGAEMPDERSARIVFIYQSSRVYFEASALIVTLSL